MEFLRRIKDSTYHRVRYSSQKYTEFPCKEFYGLTQNLVQDQDFSVLSRS